METIPQGDLVTESSASPLLADGPEVAALRQNIVNLELALLSRDLIGQAKGILMAHTGCTADEAFELLRAQSQRENRKLVEIAVELTAGAEPRR